MSTILDLIIENKRREIDAKSEVDRDSIYTDGLLSDFTPKSFSKALTDDQHGIIAEFKRRSPSKGEIHPFADVTEVVKGYEQNGAAACSILTDTRFFGGAITDLALARKNISLPILRKDFVVDEYQICEAAAFGANAILLIASVLSFDEIIKFTDLAHRMNLEVLLEMHSREELDKFTPEVDMVGINNRNLATFETDPSLSVSMAKLLPDDTVKIAESGLTSLDEIKRLKDVGYKGFLIGETFMKNDDPGLALKDFLKR